MTSSSYDGLHGNVASAAREGVTTGVASGGLVLERGDGEVLTRRWGYPMTIKIDALNGGAEQFFVGTERIPPGRKIHPHRHDHAEELLFVVAGQGAMLLHRDLYRVAAGSIVFVPRSALHGLTNTGTEDLEIVFTFPTQGIDRYFRETSAPAGEAAQGMSAPDLAAVRRRFEDYVLYEEEDLSHYIGS